MEQILEDKLNIDSPYPISESQISFFKKNGFIKLSDVLSPEAIAYYGKEISQKVLELNTLHLPMEARSTTKKHFYR